MSRLDSPWLIEEDPSQPKDQAEAADKLVEPPASTDEDFGIEASSLNSLGNSTPAGDPDGVWLSLQPICFCGHVAPECLPRHHQHSCAKWHCRR